MAAPEAKEEEPAAYEPSTSSTQNVAREVTPSKAAQPVVSKPRAPRRKKEEKDETNDSAVPPVKRSKGEYNALAYAVKHAPEDIKDGWAKVKDLHKGNPSREELFDALVKVKKGDYTSCRFVMEKKVRKTQGQKGEGESVSWATLVRLKGEDVARAIAENHTVPHEIDKDLPPNSKVGNLVYTCTWHSLLYVGCLVLWL